MLVRIIQNWKTTSAAILAAIVAVGAWVGWDVDGAVIGTLLSAVYGILLLFAKD